MEASPRRLAAPLAAPPGGGLTAREQINVALLRLDRARRRVVARAHRSRLLRWRYRVPAAADLLLAPPDLRTQDAGFADELAAGSLGLAGAVVDLAGRSPFLLEPPSRAWLRELHGFAWLRHLELARSRDAELMARALVAEWIRLSGRRRLRPAWEPELVARRIIAWLAHAPLLLDRAKRPAHARVMKSLTAQIKYLTAAWRNAPDGYPRLLALIALVTADLCIASNERRLAYSAKLLVAELERQILADGGHLSRNPWVLVELLLDLLPLRQCFAAQGNKPDPKLTASVARMGAMLRQLRLGDGMLARFNAAEPVERGALATVLAYDASEPSAPSSNPPSGYVRLERGTTIVLVDVGAPPPLALAATACAGCLSFEMSTGSELLLVNAGTPAATAQSLCAIARATASHNTLCLNEQSSSKLIRNARLEREIGGTPLRHPDLVSSEIRQPNGALELECTHDGYGQRLDLLHTRILRLDAHGSTLQGVDRLRAARGVLRFAWDLPFAIHFHLSPGVEAHAGAHLATAELLLANGEHWRLSALGAAVSIEPSLYLADAAGPRAAQQVVLRGVCAGASEVAWTLERMEPGAFAPAAARRTEGKPLGQRLSRLASPFDTADSGESQ